MRWIDADKLKAEFDLIVSKSATGEWQSIPIKHIKQIIDNAPTVAESIVIDKINADTGEITYHREDMKGDKG